MLARCFALLLSVVMDVIKHCFFRGEWVVFSWLLALAAFVIIEVGSKMTLPVCVGGSFLKCQSRRGIAHFSIVHTRRAVSRGEQE